VFKNKLRFSKFYRFLLYRNEIFVGNRTALCSLINVTVKTIINSYIVFVCKIFNIVSLFIFLIPAIGSFKKEMAIATGFEPKITQL